jgi:hypothetical protein
MSNTNMPIVARHIRERYPRGDIVVLADLDKKTGEPDRYAVAAAGAAGGRFAVPRFDDGPAPDRKDFNDMARVHGKDAVREAIELVSSATAAAAGNSSASDWPDLVPLQGGELPRLLPNTLGGWLGDYASAVAEATEVPLELAAAMTLGAASTAAARRLRLFVNRDYSEPLNLWLLPALAPGNRKSAVERLAVGPLREWEREKATAMKAEIEAATSAAKFSAARAKELRTEAAKIKDEAKAHELINTALEIERNAPVIPKAPQLWTSDSTPENLGVLLADNDERMAWISAEGGFFEIVGGRYSKGVPNLDLMLKAHSGDPERVDRIGRPPVYLAEPLLTVAISPQPEVLRGLVDNPGFRGRGLLARFLYFLPPSPLGHRTLDGPAIPERIAAAYRERLWAMLDWPAEEGRPHLVRLSAAAQDAQRDFALAIERLMLPGASFEHATDWAGKAPGVAARVAGVLHAAEHADGCPWTIEIPPGTMERAANFVATSGQHALAAFHLMSANKEVSAAAKLWGWVARRRLPEFTVRDAWQALKGSGAFARMSDISTAIEVLEERGYVRTEASETKSGPGRPPSPRILVRPDLTQGWRR